MSYNKLNIDKDFWKKVKECWSNNTREEENINQTVEDVLDKRTKRKRIKSALEFLTDDSEDI